MDFQGITGMLNQAPLLETGPKLPSKSVLTGSNDATKADHEEIVAAAKQFEAVFLNQLLKAMRKTVPESKLFNSGGPTKFYQQMQDAEMAKAMAQQNGGLGIADLIVQQVEQLNDSAQSGVDSTQDKLPTTPLPVFGPSVESYQRNSSLGEGMADRIRLRSLASRQGQAVADTLRRFEPELHAAADDSGLSPELILAVVMAESGGDPQAQSPRGAQGLMQLMPATAVEMGVEDSNHPGQNLQGGSKYLAKMLSKYDGNLPVALAAYNAGPGNVDRAGKMIPDYPETQKYVRSVLVRLKELGGGTDLAFPSVIENKPESNSE